MKRFLKVGLVAVMCFGVMSILSGCTNYERLATDAATGQFEQKGFAGEIDDSRADKIPTSVEGEPDNHEMMTMVMLQQAGYDSDLSTYDRVDLVTLTLKDGSEIKVVVLNEGLDVVFPQNLESAK
ncbi:MAG: hypothetical protein PF636_09375 [Actinomycetota bacterium]|jgi:hypothetical protein|nr:hypothetical protein [Actinomycetota bacterium]